MGEMLFRLRINYQKLGRLRYLSHLELTRFLERTVRRAGLPYALSLGFNAHMRYAPGPALPVGTESLDEYFDVLLVSYVAPEDALDRLRLASMEDVPIIGVSYVDPKAKGLQATHVHEEYQITLDPVGRSEDEVRRALEDLIDSKELLITRKEKKKLYDLSKAVVGLPSVSSDPEKGLLIVGLRLMSTEQGSIRPESLMEAVFTEEPRLRVLSTVRVRLTED